MTDARTALVDEYAIARFRGGDATPSVEMVNAINAAVNELQQ